MRFFIVNLTYLAALVIASPWLVYQAITKGKYRAGAAAKFWGQVDVEGGGIPVRQQRSSADLAILEKDARPLFPPRLWIHAVSVGEVALADVILKRVHRRWPQLEVVVSATSKAGYELAKSRFPDHQVTYAPLDFSWSVNRALDRIRPDLLMLVELEMWPNLIWSAHRRGIPVVIVNGRLSAASHRGYRRVRPLVASVLGCIDQVTASSQAYADRFVDLGAPAARVASVGSIKFDGAETDRANERTRELARLAGLQGDEVVFVVGSTQDPEEMMALSAYRALVVRFPKLRLILVPRHPERFDEVATQLDASGVPWRRRTQLAAPIQDSAVLMVDTVGELGAWWGVADIAFVGGSLGSRGGQNMIEPAAYGAAVCFGPNTRNFREVTKLLLEREAACVVHSAEELSSFVESCLLDRNLRNRLGANAQSLVVENRGALDKTLDRLAPLVESVLERSHRFSNVDGRGDSARVLRGPQRKKTHQKLRNQGDDSLRAS